MRGLLLALAVAAANAGCLGRSFVDAQVAAASGSEGSLDTLHDYEVGQVGAMARLAELEALYAASGADSRVSLLLARAWCKVSSDFTLDAHEQALESGDGPSAAYHRTRASAGFRRAQFYADDWLERRSPGFGASLARDEALAAWLARIERADAAEPLLWAGMARIGYADSATDAGAAAQARRLGKLLLQRSLSLAPQAAAGLSHLGLAAAAVRAPAPDLALAERELALAEAAASGRLMVSVLRARSVLCLRRDRVAFERELDRVLSASDPDPRLRLENAVAKRRARRYLTSAVVGAECFDPR